MVFVQPLPFEEARRVVVQTVRHNAAVPRRETVPLPEAPGRVLAAPVTADRDYPPLPRSIRDGFAVRAAEFKGSAAVIAEVRAGSRFAGIVGPGEAVEIMTGAPVPEGADAVIMVEHVTRDGDRITTSRSVCAGDFIVAKAAECREGACVVGAGTRLTFRHLASLASVGASCVRVFRRPEVAILATGDELLAIDGKPEPHQIRNSNSPMLAAQVRRAGGVPRVLPVAPDEYDATRELIEQGLHADLLLLSGGVSAGKYDIVENVFRHLGAEFFFDRVLIQPGQPVVFGRARNCFFFGLPGNPASTMVTFETLARAALDLLGGCTDASLGLLFARLRSEFRHRPGLTRFLPAILEPSGRDVTPVPWQGSGDVFALARSNAFLVARAERDVWSAGEMIEVLPR